MNISAISSNNNTTTATTSNSEDEIKQLAKQRESLEKQIQQVSESKGDAKTKQTRIQQLQQQIQQIDMQIQRIQQQRNEMLKQNGTNSASQALSYKNTPNPQKAAAKNSGDNQVDIEA